MAMNSSSGILPFVDNGQAMHALCRVELEGAVVGKKVEAVGDQTIVIP